MNRRERFAAWADRASPGVFLMPAVLIVLALSIFPLIISLYLSLTRFKFEKGGFSLTFVGWLNYKKLLFGSQQFHLLGTLQPISATGWIVIGLIAVLLAVWFVAYLRRGATIPGGIGRLLVISAIIAATLLFAAASAAGGQIGRWASP